MDKVSNPYTPGAGIQPHELVGRDEIKEEIIIALKRAKMSRSQQGIVLFGLRGVGKTVLLMHCAEEFGEKHGVQSISIEITEESNFLTALVTKLRKVTLQTGAPVGVAVKRVFACLANIVKTYGLQVSLDFGGVKMGQREMLGLADSKTLVNDLPELMENVGKMAQEQQTAIVLFVDELQFCGGAELSALCAAMHRVAQLRLPILLVAAGLPQIRGFLGKAKSYAERMFRYVEVGALTEQAAADAITKPARDNEVEINRDAVEAIFLKTRGYPYFIQEWGKNSWDVAPGTPITLGDVTIASSKAIRELDSGFFRVRYDRLAPSEKKVLASDGWF